jgi:hypothetical protein
MINNFLQFSYMLGLKNPKEVLKTLTLKYLWCCEADQVQYLEEKEE